MKGLEYGGSICILYLYMMLVKMKMGKKDGHIFSKSAKPDDEKNGRRLFFDGIFCKFVVN